MAATFTKLKNSAFIVGDEWGNTTVAENARQSLIALACREFDLGGSLVHGVDGTGAQDAESYKPTTVPGADLQGFTVQARVRVCTDAAGTSVTPKIRDITNSSDLATGTAVTATTPTEQVIAITLPAFTREFRLMLTKSNADALVYGVGKIEVLTP